MTMVLMGTGVSACAEANITAMTFNVRYGGADDGANNWDNRKDIMIAAIQQCAPDVLGLQECLQPQAAYLEQKLPDYAWFGVGRELLAAAGAGEDRGVGVARKAGKLAGLRHQAVGAAVDVLLAQRHSAVGGFVQVQHGLALGAPSSLAHEAGGHIETALVRAVVLA